MNLYSLHGRAGQLACLLLLSLVACSPRTQSETVAVRQEVRQVSFYPSQTGVIREYLPENSPIDAPRIVQQVQGPTTFNGERVIATRTVGLGLDLTSYRIYNPQGVFLRREDGPGYSMLLEPAIQEYPAAAELRVGAVWQGSSEVQVTYTEAPSDMNQVRFRTEYRYTVVDKRTVQLERGNTRLGSFEVYVITLEAQRFAAAGGAPQNIEREIWFSPYLGEVRSEEGGLLVASNLRNVGTLSFSNR